MMVIPFVNFLTEMRFSKEATFWLRAKEQSRKQITSVCIEVRIRIEVERNFIQPPQNQSKIRSYVAVGKIVKQRVQRPPLRLVCREQPGLGSSARQRRSSTAATGTKKSKLRAGG